MKQLQEAVGNALEQIGIVSKWNLKGSTSKRNNEQMGVH
jgi:hypothetical protein